jgi:DNA polymerase V
VLTVVLLTTRYTDELQDATSVTIFLPIAPQDTAELLRSALQSIEQMFREGYRSKKAGVSVTELVPAHQVQTHLFEQHDREQSQQLMAALDAINMHWGAGTIRYGAVGGQPCWRMRCVHRSPRYTTRWQELVVVWCAS